MRVAVVLGLFLLTGIPRLFAAEVTDVVDALDDANDDPFDLHIEPRFSQRFETGTIIRETNCSPLVDFELCPDEPDIVFTRELEYERRISELAVDLQIGIWHDLEFHMTLPIVISDTRTLVFAGGGGEARGVTQEISTIDPSDLRIDEDLRAGGLFTTYRYFTVGDEHVGPERSGLGDVSFGFAWSPFNQERLDHLATLTLTIDYVAPTAEAATRSNTSVGRGVHEFQFGLAASRRFGFIEPYFAARYVLPLAASDSLFVDHGGGQVNDAPGQRAEVNVGSEFVAYENPAEGQLITIDLGFGFAYHAEGRDYTPLFDALAASECSGLTPAEADFDLDGSPYEPASSTPLDAAACAWILQQPANRVANPGAADVDQEYIHDGITTVESYATIGAHVGANFQISDYVELRIFSDFETETQHFLTSARTGTDRDGDDEVDFRDPNERNPTYNPTLDGVGRRLRVESVFNLNWGAVVAFQF